MDSVLSRLGATTQLEIVAIEMLSELKSRHPEELETFQTAELAANILVHLLATTRQIGLAGEGAPFLVSQALPIVKTIIVQEDPDAATVAQAIEGVESLLDEHLRREIAAAVADLVFAEDLPAERSAELSPAISAAEELRKASHRTVINQTRSGLPRTEGMNLAEFTIKRLIPHLNARFP